MLFGDPELPLHEAGDANYLPASARGQIVITRNLTHTIVRGKGTFLRNGERGHRCKVEFRFNADTDWIYYLELDPVDMATITGSPTNWTDLYGDTSVGGYASWSAPDDADWIAVNETRNGFVIESIYSPGSDYVAWGVYGDDDGTAGGDTTFTEGQVAGPQYAVPEPGSVCAMILALGMVTIAVRRRNQAEWQPLV